MSVSASTTNRRIGITLGDCAGIGPEIVALALKSGRLPDSTDYVVIGRQPDCKPGDPTPETARAAAAALEEAVTLARRAELEERLVVLREGGRIRHYGVSNFDPRGMRDALRLPGGAGIAADQILYHLDARGPERKLIPWCVERGILVMAYSPLAQGRLGRRPALERVARRHACSPERVALAWSVGARVIQVDQVGYGAALAAGFRAARAATS